MSHNSSERPFSLAVSQEDLDFLRQKLEVTRLPDELDGAGWAYGAPLSDIRRLLARWKDGFDWRAAETAINQLPMFTRDIDVDGFGTLNIHYVHQKSALKNAVPLLFVHGWPGHFLEVRKMLPLLTAASPEHPSLHVVAVSLPGFGFSEAPKRPGFGSKQYAEVVNKLMLSLGYEEYVYQGGDWGHIVGMYTVTHYGHKHLKAWLTNMPLTRRPSFFEHPLLYLRDLLPYDQKTRGGMEKMTRFLKQGCGYWYEQATNPQTLGYSLADSPVGLLAWIYEKLVQWSDDYPWTDDEVLEWISIYWFSRAGPAASLRIYYEMTERYTKERLHGMKLDSVPVGIARFPGEHYLVPKSWEHTLGRVVFRAEHEKGGHFAAFEQPEALVEDIRHMFGKGGGAYGIVPGKDGYA
ncbi:alpha/beta-hydrolase [Trametes sanguinea]|nr:alpha/beta-hydrolase [Trametes sanguinea]